jgi:hypothetical protein
MIGNKYKDLVGNVCTLIAVRRCEETGREDAWVQYEENGSVKQTTVSAIKRYFISMEHSKLQRTLDCARALGARLRARLGADDTKAVPGDRAALLDLDLIEAEIYREEVAK